MKIEVVDGRCYYDDGDERAGKIALFIESDFNADALVSLDELIELRAEIDKYLTRVALVYAGALK